MRYFRHLSNVATLMLNGNECIGCGACIHVCPHGVFDLNEKKARLADRDGCMECGACARNCPVKAITVTPGVGCAAYIIQTWIKGKNNGSRGGVTACC
jgi:ferredoxin